MKTSVSDLNRGLPADMDTEGNNPLQDSRARNSSSAMNYGGEDRRVGQGAEYMGFIATWARVKG